MTIDELKRLEKALPPGLWRFDEETGTVRRPNGKWVGDFNGATDDEGRLSAAARNALPKLLAVAEAAKRVCARMRDGEPGITDYDDAVDDLERALAELEAQS